MKNPGLRHVRLKQEYDLFIVFCQSITDLLYINSIENWKEKCRIRICYIDELWKKYVPRYYNWYHVFKNFDHIFIGLQGTVDALSEVIGRKCHYIPIGIDAIRFSPYPFPLPRVIDVCSIGRRNESIHRTLLEIANKNKLFYIYDTAKDAGNIELISYQCHRQQLANIANRSKFFIVQNPPK